MLSSIHPFGERARNQSYPVTAIAFLIGATIGGAILGIVSSLITLGTSSVGLRSPILAGAALLVAALWEASGRPVPSLARQVDDAWLTKSRGWVYGLGFGAQLGVGFVTYVTTPLTYGFVAAGILLGDPGPLLTSGAIFGVTRGLSVFTTARVDSPDELRSFFLRMQRLLSPARTGASVLLGAGLALVFITVGDAL
jgi:cytochrome c biogenesis protein CcdA